MGLPGLRRRAACLLAAGLVSALLAPAATGAQNHRPELSEVLAREVTGDGARRHLERFQQFADRYEGNRAVGTRALRASEDYVAATLEHAGYEVTLLPVPYRGYAVDAESTTVLGEPGLRLTTLLMQYSPALPHTTAPLAVPPGAGGQDPDAGCDPADYAGRDYTGTVVLLPRGSCSFTTQRAVAEQAGAAAVLLYWDTPSPGNVYRLRNWTPGEAGLPMASIPENQALALARRAAEHPVRLTLDWRGRPVDGVTRTVLAETTGGSPDRVVMAGAHLDSVAEAPGINDNGTSAAALLQTALRLAPHQDRLRQRVRFAWWGAEELVDVGSIQYAQALTPEERRKISVYLNFELIASPNAVRYLLRGENVVTEPFLRYLDGRGLPYAFHTPASVGSDHMAFLDVGIPVGGMDGGTMEVLTPEQAAVFGGTAGQMHDPCYHQACDRIENVNWRVMDENTRMIAAVVGDRATRP